MTQPTAEHVQALVDAELRNHDTATRANQMLVEDFQRLRVRPREITVNFSGGFAHKCWTVTRSNGAYSVVYMPRAGYFSLCADSAIGPLDMGIHGPAIQCFGSV